MKYLEHRRHSIRKIPLSHLNQRGISLARTVGNSIHNISFVITSPIIRAFETAIAMGYAVNETIEELASLDDVELEINWKAGFKEFSQVYKQKGYLFTYADSLRGIFTKYLQKLPNKSTLLVISHGGIVEASAVGCLPDFDFSKFNHGVSYCEGFRFQVDGDTFQNFEFLKVD